MLKKLAGYAAYMFAATSVLRLLSFVANMAGIKVRSKGDYGDYTTYVAIYSAFNIVLTSGLAQTVHRFAANDATHRKHFAIVVGRIFVALLFLCGLASVPIGLHYGWTMAMALWGAPWLIITTYSRFLIQSRLEPKRDATLFIVGSLSTTLFQLGFLFLTSEAGAMIYGDFAALVLTGIVAIHMLPAVGELRYRDVFLAEVPRKFLKEAGKFAIPTWGSAQMGNGSLHIRRAYVRTVLGAAAMGANGLMEYLWQFVSIPMDLLGQAIMPGLVKETEDRPTLYLELVRLCLIAFPSIGICVAGGMPFLLEALKLGPEWDDIPSLLLLNATVLPVMCFDLVTKHYAVAEGKPNYAFYTSTAFLVPTVILIYPLGHAYGLHGVVGTTCIALTIHVAWFAWPMWKDHRREISAAVVWSVLASVFLVSALFLCYHFRGHVWSGLMAAPALALYVAGLFLARVARISDLSRLIGLVRDRFRRKAPQARP